MMQIIVLLYVLKIALLSGLAADYPNRHLTQPDILFLHHNNFLDKAQKEELARKHLQTGNGFS